MPRLHHFNRRKTGKTARHLAIAILAPLFLGAAISPGVAASELANADRGALALIVAFSILFLALIYEVWRLTRLNRSPKAINAHERKHNISHE
jgi:hypothetical protein